MEFGFRVRGYTNHYILIIKMESCHNDIGIWLVQLHPAEFSWSLYSSHCLERFHEVTIGWWNAEQLESLGSFRSAKGCVSISQELNTIGVSILSVDIFSKGGFEWLFESQPRPNMPKKTYCSSPSISAYRPMAARKRKAGNIWIREH